MQKPIHFMGENVSKIKMHWNFLPEPREALNL